MYMYIYIYMCIYIYVYMYSKGLNGTKHGTSGIFEPRISTCQHPGALRSSWPAVSHNANTMSQVYVHNIIYPLVI